MEGHTLTAPNIYLPGTVPADNAARDRLLYYRRDTAIPKHRFNWNFLVDLPFGRGKLLGRNSSRLVDAFIGGWQIAGFGQLYSRYFQLPTGNIANSIRSSITARSIRSRIAAAESAMTAGSFGTDTYPPTGSTATMPQVSRTA